MTALTATPLRTGEGSRALIVLPSLGTAVEPLWRDVACRLPADWTVVGVDLPGHGRSAAIAGADGPAAGDPVASTTIAELADAVLAAVRESLPQTTTFAVAGDSVGGAIALQLALAHPEAVDAVAVFCSGATIGVTEAWNERAAHVEAAGAASMVDGSRQRWFAPGFADAHPVIAGELLGSLAATERHSYAAVCRALAAFDVRDQLDRVRAPVLAVAGEHDAVTPVANLEEIAAGVPDGRLVVVDDAGHLVPAEAPVTTARLLTGMLG
jgi:3-oxoadipate enol-lactonase